MKIINQEKRQGGSTLLLVLLITVVLGWTLASYLFLVANERTLAARSQDWNAAIPLAEAGIEEALTQLTYAGSTNNLTTNGWTLGGDGMYHHNPRSLTASSFYGTAIQLAAQPTIWSTGFVASPFNGTSHSVKRLVKVVAFKTSGSGYGILARGTVGLSGGAFVDSFDSTDSSHSTNHLYVQSMDTSNAVVLTDSAVAGAINLSGGAAIYGSADTAAGGTVTGATSATTVRNDANVQINDPGLPAVFTNGSGNYSITLPSGTVNGTNYDYVATNGNYMLLNLTIQGSTKMVVNGNVTVYCTQTGNNCLVVGGSGFIYLTPGSSLNLYIAGPSTISGGGVVNGSQSASQCNIYGLPNCTAMTYSGSANFIGVVDTPEADFTFSGNESASGAFTVKTATISGSGGVHYDTSLNSGGKGYVVQSWNEMPAR